MSWYKIGTVNVTKNSNIVTGVGTKWINQLSGVSAGRMLILQTSKQIEIYEIESVQSDTQLTLSDSYSGETLKGLKYKIPTSPSVSIEQFALEIASSLAYHQKQLDGWQKILTGSGDVTLTAPDGQKITIKSQKSLSSAIDSAVKKSGDTMTGQLTLSQYGVKLPFDNGNMIALKISSDNYSHIFYDSETQQRTSILVYNPTKNEWNFPYVNDVTINGKSVLKIGDYGIGSSTGAIANNFDDHLDGGFYQCRTTDFSDLQLAGNSTATLLAYPSNSPTWKVEQLSVVNSKEPRIYYRCDTRDGKQKWHEAVTTANVNNYIPVGVPLPWPTNQPPAGWLECNGSTFDKNKFPKLAVVYPTGKLPDLRGVFIRGKDNLRGLDPYRDILSYQDDAIRNIKGGLPTGNFKALLGHAKIDAGDKNGAILTQSAGDDYIASSASSSNPRQLRWMFFDFDASRVVPTANENRPRNVAFNYIVKAE